MRRFTKSVNVRMEPHVDERIKEIIKQDRPYKYIAIDTISKLEEWCEADAKKTEYKKWLLSVKDGERVER